MLGHRMLTTEDYLTILKRRGWIVAVPALILPLIAVGITFLIPAQYISQTLVLVEQQKVPDDYVKPVISADLDSRLASMKEQILSRSRLQPIIERYNLSGGSHVSMDDRIDGVRKSILIKPIHSEIAHSGGLPGFFIAFTAGDPHTAQLVCGEITSLFVSENLRSREASAQGTTEFLKGQLADAKRNLDDQDAKLAEFQRKYIGKLPGEGSPNVNMLTSLNTQLEAATQQLSRMEQDKSYMEAILTQQLQNTAAPGTTATLVGSGTSLSPAQQELQALQLQEAELSSHYTADYPDVIAVRRKIAEKKKEVAAEVVPAAGTPAASKREPMAVQQLRAQIQAVERGIQAKRQEQAQIQSNVRIYQDRIQSSPMVEEQYKLLTRDYQTAQSFYDTLLVKMNQSKMASDLEKRQQGEQFRIMDEPNLPDGPTFPKRGVFVGAGIAVGLFFGLLIVALLEYRDTTMRTEKDVYAFTHLPTLAVIAYSSEVWNENPRTERPKGWKTRVPKLFRRKKAKEVLAPAGS